MRWYLALSCAALLCGCDSRERSAPSFSGTDEVASDTNERRITAGEEATQPTELIEAARRTGNGSVEKAIQAVKQREDGVAALIQTLRDENHFVQLAAATALTEMGSRAVLDVTHLLSDEDDDVRTWAIAILGAIGKPASKAVRVLHAALDDQRPEIAALAATALAQIGGREATSIFATSITHPNKEIREQAVSFLKSAEAGVAVPALIVALKDKESGIRLSAAVGLYARYASPEAASAVPGLCEALHDSNAKVRWWAAHALAAFNEKPTAAVPHLIESLKDADRSVRREAVDALGRIGPEQGVVKALIGMLQDRDPHIRAATAERLGNMGAAAAVAVPALKKLRVGSHTFVARAVDEAIKRLSE